MERCGFFDSKLIDGNYDRVYVADTFASYFASFIGNGIFNNKESEIINVRENNPKGMSVLVTPGQAWINGYWYKNTDNLELNLSIADGLLNRIDSIVLRWDKNQRNMYLKVLEGSLSANPTAPLPVRNAEYFDLLIATVDVKAGTYNISQRQITDRRMDKLVCGFVTSIVDQVDTTTLYRQFEDFYNNFVNVEVQNFIEWSTIQKEEFTAWFDGIKDILDEKVVTNLLNLIEKLRLSIAQNFDAATQFEVGNYLNYNNILYKCTTRHLGEWDEAHFSEVKVMNEVERIEGDLSSLNNTVQTQGSSIDSLQNTVSGHTTTLNGYGTRLTNVESKASTNAANISSQGTRLTNVEGKSTTNANDIINIKSGKLDIFSGIGFHNSIFRGKNLGSTFTSAQKTALQNGTCDDLFVGDYWQDNHFYYIILEFVNNYIYSYERVSVNILMVSKGTYLASNYWGSSRQDGKNYNDSGIENSITLDIGGFVRSFFGINPTSTNVGYETYTSNLDVGAGTINGAFHLISIHEISGNDLFAKTGIGYNANSLLIIGAALETQFRAFSLKKTFLKNFLSSTVKNFLVRNSNYGGYYYLESGYIVRGVTKGSSISYGFYLPYFKLDF